MKQNYLSKWDSELEKSVNNKKRGTSLKPDILHKYGITYKMIAEWFDYKSAKSFNSSSLKQDMLKGISEVIKHIEEKEK